MELKNIKLGLVAVALCAGLSANAELSRDQLSRIAAGDDVVAFEMYWPQRDAQAIADRVSALAGLINQSDVKTDDVTALLGRSAEGERVSIKALSGAPNLAFAYVPQYDEIRIADQEKLSTADPALDIGESKAIDLAFDALNLMDKAGLLNAGDFNPASAQVGYRKVAGGTIEGVVDYSHIVEYRVTYRRVVNGIELANSGVRIGVHANGGLASVRLGGVEITHKKQGAVSVPQGQGGVFARTVSRDDIASRFSAQQPKEATTRVAYNKLMYVMPDDVRSAVVKPTEVFAYSLAFPTESDADAISRRQIVGFDVTNSKASVLNYTAPTHQVEKQPKRVR